MLRPVSNSDEELEGEDEFEGEDKLKREIGGVYLSFRPFEHEEVISSPLEDEIFNLAREVALDRSTADTPDDQFRIAVATSKGALPDLERDLSLDLRDPEVKKPELEEHTPRVDGLRRLLSEMVLGPVRLVRDYLCAMTYVGPLRFQAAATGHRLHLMRRDGHTGLPPGIFSTLRTVPDLHARGQ